MARYDIRLTQVLSLDDKLEADTIKRIEQLRDKKELSGFLTSAVRLAVAHPELLSNSYGPDETRTKFFATLRQDVAEQKKKVDSIYELSRRCYDLALLGKRIGLEGKANQLLRAGFILERQEKELSNLLGDDLGKSVYASDKMDSITERAEQVIEDAIQSYDGVLAELVSSQQVTVSSEQKVAEETEVKAIEAVQPSVIIQPGGDEYIDLDDDTVGEDGPTVEFGGDDASLEALSAFLNGN